MVGTEIVGRVTSGNSTCGKENVQQQHKAVLKIRIEIPIIPIVFIVIPPV